jgi:hypothetical protein
MPDEKPELMTDAHKEQLDAELTRLGAGAYHRRGNLVPS